MEDINLLSQGYSTTVRQGDFLDNFGKLGVPYDIPDMVRDIKAGDDPFGRIVFGQGTVRKIADNVGGFLTGENSRRDTAAANAENQRLAEQARSWQLEDRTTAYQDSVSDVLRAAEKNGISPYLLLQNLSPAAVTTVSGGSASKADSSAGVKALLSVLGLLLGRSLLGKFTGAKAADAARAEASKAFAKHVTGATAPSVARSILSGL